MMREEWIGFNEEGRWCQEGMVNVRSFIQRNYTPYDGDESFLAGPTRNTLDLWLQVRELSKEEIAAGGVLDMETSVVSTLTAYGPGYINEELKDLEKIVGLQTDKPLKRAFMPYGGIKMAEESCVLIYCNVRFSTSDISKSPMSLQHFLYFFPLPHGHGSLGLIFMALLNVLGCKDNKKLLYLQIIATFFSL